MAAMLESDEAGLIERALAQHWNPERERTRSEAMTRARRMISGKLGKLEREDWERVFGWFNADHSDGRETLGRFGRALTGANTNELLARLDVLNQWTERLWVARGDDELAVLLDEFWKVQKRELPRAGQTFPTVLLHARGPEGYWPYFDRLEPGYMLLSGNASPHKSGAGYIEYVQWVRQWRKRRRVPTDAVELVLVLAGQTQSVLPSQDDALAEAPAEVPNVSTEPSRFELKLDVSMFGRVCKVRRSGANDWPADGHVLPLPLELHRIARDNDARELEELGRQLFEALFAEPELAQAYAQLRADAAQAGAPLRLLLCCCPDHGAATGACNSAAYFWERMLDPQGRVLAIDDDLRLVRRHALMGDACLPGPCTPLRVGVGIASPRDHVALNQASEWSDFLRLERSLSGSTVLSLDVRPDLDSAGLAELVRERDVLHYAGHGDPGGLWLEDAARMGKLLASDALLAMLSSGHVPTLVVLNACHGSTSIADVRSVAEAFLSKGVTAVVAMGSAVSDRTSVVFAEELYKRLAEGLDVEHAVQRARWRAFAESTMSWYLPVLWTRAPSGFALVDPHAAATDPVVEREVRAINERAEALRVRVRLLERLDDVEPEHRSEMASSLLGQVEDRSNPWPELERVLADENERQRQLAQLRRHEADPQAGLRAFADTLRRELTPQLSAAAQALRDATAQPVAISQGGTPTSAKLDTREFGPSAALRLPADRDLGTIVDLVLAQSHLHLPTSLVRRCVLHLLAGRHLVLAGPPGTGKSSLAKALTEAFGYSWKLVTANPDWTTFDTIGGIAPEPAHDHEGRPFLSYPFRPGKVLEAVAGNWVIEGDRYVRGEGGTWLVIDEMNRAPLDQAFGDLFTALVEWKLPDPRRAHSLPIPHDFRLICTTNTADRRLLFEFSEALKRRFAFVEVPAFFDGERGLGDYELIRRQLGRREVLRGLPAGQPSKELIDKVQQVVERIRVLFPLGLAQVLDVLTYVQVGAGHEGQVEDELLSEALVDNLLPLLESQPAVLLEALACLFDGEQMGRWIGEFLDEATYRPDAERARIAGALLQQLAGHHVRRGDDWAAAFGRDSDEEGTPTRRDIVVERLMPSLGHAAELATALHRLAEERHG